MVITQVTHLGYEPPHFKVEIWIDLLRKLYEYRLVLIVDNLASRPRSRASVVVVRYVPVRYAGTARWS